LHLELFLYFRKKLKRTKWNFLNDEESEKQKKTLKQLNFNKDIVTEHFPQTNFKNPLSLKVNGVNLGYFKLYLFNLVEFLVLQVAKI